MHRPLIDVQPPEQPRNTHSRREFLRNLACGAAAFGSLTSLTQRSLAYEITQRIRKVRTSPALDPQLLALVNRTSFGFSRAQYAIADEMGYKDYLEWQLDYENIDDNETDVKLAAYPTLTMTSQEIRDNYDNDSDRFVPALELMSSTFERSAYSQRQLFERMVEFWTDHFSIFMGDDLALFLKTADDRDVIRQYAMTSFPELLNASARSAAMLWYLDNYINQVGHAQENYSRELMELHTLGVTGPYTQQDVEEVARCLTGWTIYDSPNFGNFAFWGPFHDYGTKVVLGQVIPPNGGESDGQTILDILAYHPSTAAFISRKLCVHFLGYEPAENVVSGCTQTYLDTGGDIKSMLRYILREQTITTYATPKLKRPNHLLASMVRATGATAFINNPPNYPFLGTLQLMGQLPFWWEPPNGYPDSLGAWVGGQLPRWQAASYFFDGWLGTTYDLNGLILSEHGQQPGQQATAIDRILTGGTFSEYEIIRLQEFRDQQSQLDPWATNDLFGLAASCPGFQWY